MKSKKNKPLNVYGIFLSKEDIQKMKEKTFIYLKAIIEAEKLNPDQEFDSKIYIKLLTKIAVSDLDAWQRIDLVSLLKGGEDDIN